MKIDALFALSVIFGSIFLSNCQEDAYKRLICADQGDCMSCHAAADFCHWCDDYYFIESKKSPPCNVKESLIENKCPERSIIQKKESKVVINENGPLSDLSTADPNSANQMKPQRVTVDLQPGETRTIEFEYRLARNYPLDLYYLMDLTWSMRDDKETLVELRDDLPIALQNLTKNYRLGFGSFADKPLMPYTNMDPHHRANPCLTEGAVCGPTYTFRHNLNLTEKTGDFVNVVNSSRVTGNLDNTEATIEALMQVVVCKEKMGWTTDSRKIIILATDGLVHFAGIGKLGGVVKPNDEKCHLDESGRYTESTEMDYPSLAQISRILNDNKINVIFAVTKEVQHYYTRINELLPEHTYVGRLEADSSNILSLVQQGYEDFVSVINFVDDAQPSIKLRYFSDCGTDGPVVETSACENIKIGETYKFFVKMSMDKCPEPEDRKNYETIHIMDGQIGRKELTIDINLRCTCDCKAYNQTNGMEFASTLCPLNSDLNCGKCICHKGWSGSNCECDLKDGENEQLAANCVDSSKSTCSGSGDCRCGVCECDPGFFGNFCECRDCDMGSNGLVCSGPEHGACACGTCACAPGWSGPTCSCSTDTERCTLPGETIPCSDRGECVCGECKCPRESDLGPSYVGMFCESCPSCKSNAMCRLYADCANATLQGKGAAEACQLSSNFSIRTNIVDRNSIAPLKAITCIDRVNQDEGYCDYKFTYEVQEGWRVLLRVYPKNCSTIFQRAMFVGLIPALMVILAGILVICIWKVIEIQKERIAFKKFNAEVEEMKMKGDTQENPLYRSPITEFRLPTDFNRAKKE